MISGHSLLRENINKTFTYTWYKKAFAVYAYFSVSAPSFMLYVSKYPTKFMSPQLRLQLSPFRTSIKDLPMGILL